ncbi:uncharacterized protein LOC110913949 [Helianthus annuus]|uniref:uncharacterized protein LOC110913949 n=1 Tax=Helianthus annuus TaxID=4232 RepID=UPI001652CEE1|nr:uncharacterized protein LOC110913949 [Helianthus annuus]
MASRPSITCQNLVSLSADEANSLIEPFSLSEIKDAIWGCVGDRAPGPDGFNFKFIKNNWDLFQGDFLKVFQEFHSKGSISRCCSSSFIALIPKINDPISPSNFRPISLIGVVNKAISKVLVNRLKKVVGKLVSEEQTAFLAGRNISDGPLILNEVIAWMKRAKRPGMVFKIDINKAYGSLNWKFLESVMTQMNFPVLWRDWIMATLVSSRASVLVNGSPTMEFECTRGLRQGDPLSPFLFVIAMEALSGIIKKVVSEVYGVGVNDAEAHLMANVLGCKKGSFPFKHPGLVVGANMNLTRNWKPVIDIFKNRLSLWKAKNLSYRAPAKVLDILERLRRVFFWGGLDENSRMSWMAWEKVTAPMEYGGLGFGSLRDANLAMLSKWWWRFKMDKDGLWRRVIWAIHRNNISWAPIPAKMSIPGPWKQIIGINTHLNQIGVNLIDAIWCRVGCCSKAAFWLDIWISEQPLYVKFPVLFALEIDKSCCVSNRVSWGENTVNLSWRWIRPVTSVSEQEELLELSLLLCEFIGGNGTNVWENYTAPRIVLAASGVEHEQLLKYAEPLLSDFPGGARVEEPQSVYVGGDHRVTADTGIRYSHRHPPFFFFLFSPATTTTSPPTSPPPPLLTPPPTPPPPATTSPPPPPTSQPPHLRHHHQTHQFRGRP